jgi:Holliday junction resolvase-like predicted endonuclease
MPGGGAKGEVDCIGYDGETLALVGVRTRTVGAQLTTLPELSVTAESSTSSPAWRTAFSPNAT